MDSNELVRLYDCLGDDRLVAGLGFAFETKLLQVAAVAATVPDTDAVPEPSNRCLNALRDRRNDGIAPGVGVSGSRWASPRTGPRTALLRDERSEHIRRIIATLPPPQRDVLILRFFEDLSRAEVAAVLDLPESVVKSRVFEAFKKLRERLRETESRL